MIIGIHQPNFFPWLGFFCKVKESDVFVLLDNAQYTKNSFISRNRIKTAQGAKWLTVPVAYRFPQRINEVVINNSIDWRRTHLRTIEQNYGRSRFFSELFPLIQGAYYRRNWESLCAFNVELIQLVIDYFHIETVVRKASDLQIEGVGTERLINIVSLFGGDTYLSGQGAATYQDEALFAKRGIQLVYTNFSHPTYEQLYMPFEANLSIIDFAFNSGTSRSFQ